MKFLIKPFSEIMIKSKPVRKNYLKVLGVNLNRAFKRIEEKGINAIVFRDKLEVNALNIKEEFKKEELKTILSRMPGIESFLEVESFDLPEKDEEIFDFVFQKAKDFYLDKVEGKSFVVRVKRSGTHSFKSIDLERYIGGGLLKYGKNATVQLKNPDIVLKLEIKDNKLFLIKKSLDGIGGYPTGTQDRVVSLISGGFDSGVSTYSMMKRGCKVDFLFFNLGGSAHELGVKQVSNYLRKNFSTGYKARFVTVPFEEIVAELLTKIDSRFRAIILKRLFLKTADLLAQQHGYYAIIKGDSLGQVSSQTLKNMYVIDKASDTLVLRPLIASNKQEIVDITRKIGTYEFACNMPEYCGVVSDKPATGARLEQIIEQEEKFDYKILDKVIEEIKVEYVDKMLVDINEDGGEIENSYVPGKNEKIIDIRESVNIEKKPLLVDNVDILQIPFFEINNKFKTLDQSFTYLLFCDKGVLSKLHGLYLKELGFNNIKVYRPVEKGCKL